MQLTRIVTTPIAVAAATAILAGCSGSSSPGAPGAAGSSSRPKPPATCPLTGAVPAHGQRISRPALAVKIDNISQALPQAGVNSADIVVEELVEGGLTRLFTVFQCSSSALVGPIRSARESDADLLALLHGSVFAYSGANPKDMPPIIEHGDAALINQTSHSSAFHLDTGRAAPHDVFSSTSTLLKTGLSVRHHLHAPKPLFSYGPIAAKAKRAHQVSMSWSAGTTAAWSWAGSKWLRTQDGEPDDLSDGQQIDATNVVVLNVTIASTGLHDVLGNPSPFDVTVGSNPAWVFRNGKVVHGSWHRTTIGSKLLLRDRHGHQIALAPGRTWIELLPVGHEPTIG